MAKINAKKHGLKQLQGNDWLVTLTVSHEDYKAWDIGQDAMGTIYSIDVISSEEEESKAQYTGVFETSEKPVDKVKFSEMKLSTQAALQCKNPDFQEFCGYLNEHLVNEENTISYLRSVCGIKSRSELDTSSVAEFLFKDLQRRFDCWGIEQKYAGNLERM